jgi:hypothetical protein
MIFFNMSNKYIILTHIMDHQQYLKKLLVTHIRDNQLGNFQGFIDKYDQKDPSNYFNSMNCSQFENIGVLVEVYDMAINLMHVFKFIISKKAVLSAVISPPWVRQFAIEAQTYDISSSTLSEENIKTILYLLDYKVR